MGQISQKRVIVLVACFLATAILVYLKPESKASIKSSQLIDTLSGIKGWQNRGFIPFDNKIIETLKLDDYVNLRYSDGKDIVSLYVGYYLSTKKVGAAHDPTVCFPGQGWILSEKSTGTLELATDPGTAIAYSMMIAELEQQKELLVYWFQSYDQTMSGTFGQKLSLFWKKLLGQGEDNAFVRITVPIGDQPIEEYRDTAFRFIQAFYPVFLEFVTKG